MSVRVYQLAKELEKSTKEVIALLQDRGLAVKSASSSITDHEAEVFLKALGHGAEAIKTHEIPASEALAPQNLVQTGGPSISNISESISHAKITTSDTKPLIDTNPSAKISPPTAPKSTALPSSSRMKPAPRPPVIHFEKPQTTAADAITAFSNSTQRPQSEKKNGVEITVPPQVANASHHQHTSSISHPTLPIFHSIPPSAAPVATNSPRLNPNLPNREFKIPAPLPRLAPPPTSEKNEPDAAKPLKTLKSKMPIIVHEFASALEIKPFQLISELMHNGIFASLNQSITEEVAISIAQKHGFKLEVHRRGEESDAQRASKKGKNIPAAPDIVHKQEIRPPIVCVLGHVDHGKTTLLDAIRQTNVVAGEAGGITQHIAAYQVEIQGKKITFLDTPGHAAFAKMRQRGADITDIAILVVAADDGFMPQTDEALKFAQKADVPVVVAINKIDAKGANIDRVKQQMQQRGIVPEEWGGETLCIGVSAIQKIHIPELLELVLVQAEMLELKANPRANPEVVIIESQMDMGHGVTTTAIVQEGTLSAGTSLVCGSQYCRVRALFDDHGKAIKTAPPSTPVRIVGWSGTPDVGSVARTAKDEKRARNEAEENASLEKKAKEQALPSIHGKNAQDALATLATPTKEKILKLLVKTDVQGSIEAANLCLEGIQSDKIRWEIIGQSAGNIRKHDVELAHSSNATILGFNVAYDSGAAALAKNLQVKVLRHNIIYELIDQVRDAMSDLLDPEFTENYLGSAQVRQIFQLSKGIVAGCMVTDGKIIREKLIRLKRGKQILFEGHMASLKHLKEEPSEVRAGLECGIQLQGFTAFEIGDDMGCYEIIEQRPSL
ncbi:MAG: translation initiation factor IF-2 [Puniceicoccales bacterium]|jgi:translation initiation factor IF-2|nr:translation initiation factor IF-2 [Puniceicoccales bacterium]